MFYNKFMFIKLLTILSIILICLGNYCSAQTNQVRDLIGINTNSIFGMGFNVTSFGIYSKDNYGGGLSVYKNNKNLVNIGGTFAIIDEKGSISFYEASINLKVGKEFLIPKINRNIYLYMEEGIAINIKDFNTIFSQTVLGFAFRNDLSSKKLFYWGGGIGTNSKWGLQKPFILGTINFKF